MQQNLWIRYFLQLTLLVVAYSVFGIIGITLALQQISPLWAPSGIAIAALLLGGYRLSPGIFLGSFLTNFWYGFHTGYTFTSTIVAAEMALGATAEGLLGAYLINTFAPFFITLSRSRDIALFIILSGLISPLVASINGTLCLAISHTIPWSLFWDTWLTWWLGDVFGIIVVTPFILAWYQQAKNLLSNPLNILEAVTLLIIVVTIGALAFSNWYPIEYLLIPLLVWSVFRFGQIGAVTLTVMISVIAIVGTIHGYGEFVTPSRTASLLLLQTFIGVIAITSMILGAVLIERNEHAEELLKSIQETQKARIEAETANKTKSIFLANMHHELRTPLNHIMGYAELVQDELIDKNQTIIVDDIKKIIAATKHLLTIITDILDISKVEIGKMELEMTQFDLYPFLQNLLQIVQPLAEKNHNKLHYIFPSDIGSMLSDKSKIYRVLYNILDNACKFTYDGKITFSVLKENSEGTEWIIFIITDTGHGMKPEQIEHLFQPFERIDSPAFGGTGLGLAIAKSFTQMMHGHINVTSEYGYGSTFTIRLPYQIDS